MKTWRTIVAAAGALVLVASAWAQTPAPSPSGTDAKQLQGEIQKVDGNKLTLTDGTELTIPGNVLVQQGDLRPGASVKASYEERGGEKVATSLQIESAK